MQRLGFNVVRRIMCGEVDGGIEKISLFTPLGEIALFYASNGLKKNCYALSNPNKWGYESNSMYVTRHSFEGMDKEVLHMVHQFGSMDNPQQILQALL
jgi:hypothetical protein